MSFFKTLGKLFKRKKRNGYYEANDILTIGEKQSLYIGFSIILIPLFIAFILVILN